MITMDDALMDLYHNGMISKEMCLMYAQDQQVMKKNLY